MINIKQTAPEEFSILLAGDTVATCSFTSVGDTLFILNIEEKMSIEGLDSYDALLRSVASFTKPLGLSKVACKKAEMHKRLEGLRFTVEDGVASSTPDEVLRHLCKNV